MLKPAVVFTEDCFRSFSLGHAYRYTAVGVFVLGRTLQEAWGPQADQKQRELNAYLKVKF